MITAAGARQLSEKCRMKQRESVSKAAKEILEHLDAKIVASASMDITCIYFSYGNYRKIVEPISPNDIKVLTELIIKELTDLDFKVFNITGTYKEVKFHIAWT